MQYITRPTEPAREVPSYLYRASYSVDQDQGTGNMRIGEGGREGK